MTDISSSRFLEETTLEAYLRRCGYMLCLLTHMRGDGLWTRHDSHARGKTGRSGLPFRGNGAPGRSCRGGQHARPLCSAGSDSKAVVERVSNDSGCSMHTRTRRRLYRVCTRMPGPTRPSGSSTLTNSPRRTCLVPGWEFPKALLVARLGQFRGIRDRRTGGSGGGHRAAAPRVGQGHRPGDAQPG